jgi:hypothetical protein
MKSSAECRAMGAELLRLSDDEKNALRRSAYRAMAASWRALAEQYERQGEATPLVTGALVRQ